MSDNEESPKLGASSLLTNNPLLTDTSKTTDESKQENINFDNDLNSESITPDNNTIRRKSITSGRFMDEQENTSTPAMIDTSTNQTIQPPKRSLSETALNDTNEQPSTLPVQQDESSIDGDDIYGTQSKPNNSDSADQLRQDTSSQDNNTNDEFFNTKPRTIDDDNQQPNTPDETTRFKAISPSISSDDKRGQLPDETGTGTDTDRDNQEIATISRRPSVARSPLNRPQAPTPPDDSRQTPTNDISKLIKPGEQLQIPTSDTDNERINSPPPSPSANKALILANPIIGVETDRNSSRPTSKTSSSINKEKVTDENIIPSKSRQTSSTSQKQTTNIPSTHKGSTSTSRRNSSDQNREDSRRSSTDADLLFNDKRRSPSQKRSGQQSRKGSNKTTDSKKSGKRLSTTDSDNEPSKVASIIPSNTNQVLEPRPQSPNVEQIAEHNPKQKTPIKKKEQRRSNSAESSNQIPIVDDKSIDSSSEPELQKKRRVKSKKKDIETNTDVTKDNNLEPTSQKSSKSIRHSVKQSKDSNDDQDPVNVNVTVLVKNIPLNDNNNTKKIDHERHTQSDTEQVINDKQKKRRRPKRISRTTQTYERYFRQIESEQPEELRPTNDTDKNIQTRKSQLRPKPKSPRKHYPVYLSADAFKVEEILPQQYSQTHKNQTKTAVLPRNISPQNGKLLILRPTLPFHHTDAVNVQRISLQYAIDLIPNETKSNTPKQSEELPMLRSPVPPTSFPISKSKIKDKSISSNKTEDRTHQRKNGGAV